MSDRFRRRASAISLMLAPALTLFGHLVQATPAQHDTASELASIAAHPDRAAVSGMLGFAAMLLFVPAFFGLARPLWVRRPRLALIGLSMSVAGVLGLTALMGSEPITLAMVDGLADRAQMIALTDRYESSALMATWLVLMIVGYSLGPIVLAIGLWRTGWAWTIPAALIGGLVLFVADAGRWPLALGFALTWAGLAAAGARLLTDDRLDRVDSTRAVLQEA